MAKLTRLHKAKGSEPLALIFVHGLGGDARTTWMHNEENEKSLWPVWLGEDTGCEVWTLGYDARLSAWQENAMPLPDQGTTVVDLLASERELKDRPLVFICHSLGGLVIKTAIVHGMTQGVERHQALVERIKGIVLLATPHFGSNLATLASAVKFLLRTNEQVSDLSIHDAHLRSLHQQFLNQHQKLKFQVRTYSESRGVIIGKRLLGWLNGPKIMVVDPTSAEPHVPNEIAVQLTEDHFSICKPKLRTEPVHTRLVGLVESNCKKSR